MYYCLQALTQKVAQEKGAVDASGAIVKKVRGRKKKDDDINESTEVDTTVLEARRKANEDKKALIQERKEARRKRLRDK